MHSDRLEEESHSSMNVACGSRLRLAARGTTRPLVSRRCVIKCEAATHAHDHTLVDTGFPLHVSFVRGDRTETYLIITKRRESHQNVSFYLPPREVSLKRGEEATNSSERRMRGPIRRRGGPSAAQPDSYRPLDHLLVELHAYIHSFPLSLYIFHAYDYVCSYIYLRVSVCLPVWRHIR
ncbi:hypothetical protein E2C01_053907 [Portunus trituberculatus]|uniref:Uncharacterized protein n=1 Tax=Portunus trituberculatus TaxID=210409 RepID=A0A5B7GRR1_PORTR|nr:hypothetical protein [Portunus trituberculatus]